MKLQELFLEAGEPKDPSRRGFLKKAAAVGATAMTNPGTLATGVGQTAGQAAKSIITPIAQAMANPAALESSLVDAATSWVIKNIKYVPLSHDDSPDWVAGDPEDDYWEAGENDIGYSYTDYNDPKMKGVEGASGAMPWGQEYVVELTPNGLPFLHTSTDGYQIGILTYMDKNGNIKTKEYEHEDHGNDIDPETFEDIIDNDYGAFIDKIEGETVGNTDDIQPETPDTQKTDAAASTNASPATDVSSTVGSFAKRALLSKLGKELLSKIKGIQATPDTPPEEPDTDEPLQLPAPDKSTDDLLSPDLQRMKDLAGIKRKEQNKD